MFVGIQVAKEPLVTVTSRAPAPFDDQLDSAMVQLLFIYAAPQFDSHSSRHTIFPNNPGMKKVLAVTLIAAKCFLDAKRRNRTWLMAPSSRRSEDGNVYEHIAREIDSAGTFSSQGGATPAYRSQDN
jgi:hypothetical protein